MMIIIFIELCRIADSLLWIPKSSRRTSSIFYIPNIIALLKMESQQLHQNPHNHQDLFEKLADNLIIVRIPLSLEAIILCIQTIL
ncbi:SX2_G0051190.mRNA.1.CDS.1 [Saccharomyces cerevisiae]|nr:SX2_G0051190.mRNA.1.CDS.1 [Saccharomyces cerevisiae]